MTLNDARLRIQIEFIEMPGLKLTLAQIARLCGLSKDVCEPAVSLLVHRGFLAARADGSFMRHGLLAQADGILGPRSITTAL